MAFSKRLFRMIPMSKAEMVSVSLYSNFTRNAVPDFAALRYLSLMMTSVTAFPVLNL